MSSTRLSSLEGIAAALAEGGAEEREAAYTALEGAASEAASQEERSGGTAAPAESEAALALVVGSVRPLIASVLCAPASRVGAVEWRRASLLLYAMGKADQLAVAAEMNCAAAAPPGSAQDAEAAVIDAAATTWVAPDTVFTTMLAKEPSQWTREDALTASANICPWIFRWNEGNTKVCTANGIDEMEWYGAWMQFMPYLPNAIEQRFSSPPDRYVKLALLCLDLLRSAEVDEQPEGIIVGAWLLITHASQPGGPSAQSVAKAVWEAGFLDVMQPALRRFDAMEQISGSSQHCVSSAILTTGMDVVQSAQAAGIDVVQPLVDAGVADQVISKLSAYQELGDPELASVAVMSECSNGPSRHAVV